MIWLFWQYKQTTSYAYKNKTECVIRHAEATFSNLDISLKEFKSIPI